METPLPILAAAAPAALQPTALIPEATQVAFKPIADKLTRVLFYGLLVLGIAFPFVATIYALIML